MKKSKLFLSIMAFCFSLAVLCFGVYAAGQVDYTIGGNISYVVSDAYVEITTKVYKSDAHPNNKQDLAVVAKYLAEHDSLSDNTLHLSKTTDTTLNTLNDTLTDPYTPLGNSPLAINFGSTFKQNPSDETSYNLRSVYVVATIENLSSDVNVYAVPEVLMHPTEMAVANRTEANAVDPASYNIVEYMSEGYSVIDSGSANKKTIILAYTISELTSNITSVDFKFTIDIEAGNYTANSNLKWDSQGFWYVNMGTKTVSSTPYDVRWRLYSIDGGATRYDAGLTDSAPYNTKPEYPIGEGVFVLEDAAIATETSQGSGIYAVSEKTNIAQQKAVNGALKNDTADDLYYRAQGTTSDWEGTDNSVQFALVNGEKVLANDYFGSEMFEYLSNGYLTAIGVNTSNDTIYTNIIPRTQADLAQDMISIGDWSGDENGYIYTIESCNNNSSEVVRNASKLWLLSTREALAIICGVNDNVWDPEDVEPWEPGVWKAGGHSDENYGENYWLRSPDPSDSFYGFIVGNSGKCCNNLVDDAYLAVRAAFKLAL